MKEIPLTQDKVALVDDDYFEWLMQWEWYAARTVFKNYIRWYAKRSQLLNGVDTTVYMHRVILNAPLGMQVDHRDHDGLNNQKHNLRICTQAQNQQNRRVYALSGFKGVTYDQRCITHPWMALIRMNNQTTHLGNYATAESAARAYDEAALKLFGEFATTNFPQKENEK